MHKNVISVIDIKKDLHKNKNGLINNIDKDVKKTVEQNVPENKNIVNNKPESKVKSSLNYIGRGFKTLKDAENFVKTETFARLGIADKNEYINWLNNK